MSNTKSVLTDLNVKFEELIKNQAYKITPSSIKYKMDIVLIVKDEQSEQYTMMLFIDDDLKKEIEFKYRGNIGNSYSSMYVLGIRLIDNYFKTRHENT